MIMISVCLLVYRLYIKCHQVPSSDLFIKHPSLRLILSQAHDVRASKHAQMNRMRKEQIMKRYEKNEREIMQRESESVWGQIKRYLIKASTATTTRCAYVFPGLSLIYLILSISTYIFFFQAFPTYSNIFIVFQSCKVMAAMSCLCRCERRDKFSCSPLHGQRRHMQRVQCVQRQNWFNRCCNAWLCGHFGPLHFSNSWDVRGAVVLECIR